MKPNFFGEGPRLSMRAFGQLCGFQGPERSETPPGTRAARSLKTQQCAHAPRGACFVQARSTFLGPAGTSGAGGDRKGLPRKEVIQPHLPVRLPCYDFTPITSPTFDGSLP
jgi:hypothetical protein